MIIRQSRTTQQPHGRAQLHILVLDAKTINFDPQCIRNLPMPVAFLSHLSLTEDLVCILHVILTYITVYSYCIYLCIILQFHSLRSVVVLIKFFCVCVYAVQCSLTPEECSQHGHAPNVCRQFSTFTV